MMSLWRALMMLGIVWAAESAGAQGISVIQGSDGTSGTVIDLGNGFRSYGDSHGTTGTIVDLGGGFQTYQFISPKGPMQSGTILTIPAPGSTPSVTPGIPSAGLTPTPVLPKGPLMPQQTAPAASVGSAYGTGRFGR